MRNPLRQLETSGVGVLAGVAGCLLWQPATASALANSSSDTESYIENSDDTTRYSY